MIFLGFWLIRILLQKYEARSLSPSWEGLQCLSFTFTTHPTSPTCLFIHVIKPSKLRHCWHNLYLIWEKRCGSARILVQKIHSFFLKFCNWSKRPQKEKLVLNWGAIRTGFTTYREVSSNLAASSTHICTRTRCSRKCTPFITLSLLFPAPLKPSQLWGGEEIWLDLKNSHKLKVYITEGAWDNNINYSQYKI